ncbi:TonB-dependent receptor [Mucilaginibacter sp. UYCu711]|uniref:TonB-dependent receptor n=1 Tax=Mucilaginibacter sp. UYCu711 TaxID=3156339 RepID=UPI003D223AFE
MVIKLIILATTVVCLHVSAASFAQQITLNEKRSTLESVLRKIRQQSGYIIFYDRDLLSMSSPVTVKVDQASLEETLVACLSNQPLSYHIVDHTVVINKKGDISMLERLAAAAPIIVKGAVTDEKGEVLPGATIIIKGTEVGTIADKDGNFSITSPTTTGIMVVSFLGYVTQEIPINNQSKIDVKLVMANKTLNEVAVLGYTTVIRKDLTGAVSSLNAQQITRVQSNNLVQSLVGIAGIRVNGGASDIGDIRIRGNRSVNASNTPTVIIDGMPYYGSLNTIDQNDIASLDILKDASATALYGSRGANGVIIITTKKAAKGKNLLSFDSYSGANVHMDGNLHPMNAQQYIQFKRDANQAVGIWASPADDPKIFTAVEIAGFGKVDNKAAEEYYDKLGFQSNNTLTFSNTGDRGSQKVSLNFYNNKDRGDNMGNYDRYLFSSNIDHKATRNLTIGATSRISYEFQQVAPSGFGNALFRYPPTVKFFDDNGNIIIAPIGDPNMRNPYLDLNRDYNDSQTRAWQAFLKGFIKYDITKDLSLTSNVSMDQVFTWAGSYTDNRAATYNNALNTASISNGRQSRMTWNNVLAYKKSFGQHSIDATAVFELQNNQANSSKQTGQDITLSQYKWFNMGASLQNQTIESGFTRNQMLSYVGRVQYGFKDKYLLTATARYDGASPLSATDRWELFPSIAGAWRMVEEPFIKSLKVFSDLKLRASYGLTGNSAIAAYATQGSLTSRYLIFAGTNGDVPYATNEPNQQAVPDLKWENTRMFNAGLDFGLFNDRINGSLNYYLSQTSDLLFQRKLPYTTGFNTVWDNIGRTRNEGFEITLNARAIDTRDFKWNLSLSFYHNQEKLVELYDSRLTQDIQNNWFVGYPVTGVTYDYRAVGIWQTLEANVAAIYGRTPGEIKIKDLNGDGKIDGNDREIIGTERPQLQSSLITNFSWKQLDMSMDFYSEIGAIASDGWTGGTYGGSIARYNVPVIDYWTPTNPTNNAPQPRNGTTIQYLASIGRHSNDYIRLRNITLGYTFSKNMIPGISKLRVYAAATGPLQWWSYLDEGGLSDKTVLFNLGLNFSL